MLCREEVEWHEEQKKLTREMMELERRKKEVEEKGKELRKKRERWEQATGKKEKVVEKPNWAPPFTHPDERRRVIDKDEYKRRRLQEVDENHQER